ncbi:uncharacterized protein LOC131958284 [Physella acuta]|uniref:uncharacterized protein LOC131958284 n=1 Tax=Physella acuta TaxID=109671 RepID=UPI0027DC8886|nr:uncharacterized protein LOC131958284 [Physella acuta]
MKTSVNIFSLCLVLLTVSHTSADFNSERAKVTRACSYTVDKCVQLSGSMMPDTDAKWCTLLGSSKDGVTSEQCLVQLGYCKAEESTALKNGACAQSTSPQQTSSAIKISVYGDISKTTEQCQSRIVSCTFDTSVGTVLKQQEQFCKLMNLGVSGKTTNTCLSQSCTESEFAQLKTTACSTTQSMRFSDVIVATSLTCQNGMETCTYSTTTTTTTTTSALALIRAQRYCDVMNYKAQVTASECLKGQGCTDDEINKLKAAACSGSHIVASLVLLIVAALYKLL